MKQSTASSSKRIPKLRFPDFQNAPEWQDGVLDDVSIQVKKRIPVSKLSLENYISTENILPDFGGVKESSGLPTVNSVTQFKKGDVLMANIRPYLRKVWLSDKDGGASNDVIVFRSKNVDPVFHSVVLRNDEFINYVMKDAKGVKMPRGDTASMKNYPFPVPLLPEQQRITDCLSSLDKWIEAEAKQLDALKDHKKGLMQQLFPAEGETTPKLRFPEFQDAPEWAEKKLGSLFNLQDGFAFKSTDFVKQGEGSTQVVRISDINNQNLNEQKVYIPDAFLEPINADRYKIKAGDMLLSLTGAGGFNFYIWKDQAAVINQRTAKITPKKKQDTALVRLLEPLAYRKINERGEGQNNNLSRDFLSNVVLLVPPPPEQKKIADCLSSLDEWIGAQSKRIEALQEFKQGLMQQLFPSSKEGNA